MLETDAVTSRPAAIRDTKPSTKYTYNYNYVPPLAMVDAVSPAEGFAARPEWIHLVSISALKILFNSIMIGVKNKGDSIEFVPEVLQALNAVAQLLGADTKRDLSNAIAMELETAGFSDYAAGIESVPGRSHRVFCEDAHARDFARHRAKPWEVCNCLRSSFQPGRLQPVVPIHLIAGGQPEFSRGCRCLPPCEWLGRIR